MWESRSLHQIQPPCGPWSTRKNNPKKTKETRSDQYIPTNHRLTNQEADLYVKNAFAAMGKSSGENMIKEESRINHYWQWKKQKSMTFLHRWQ
ncbi:hypothetical protein R3W88_016265 [Solanum pinnatisectum]|uniref:Uncharacterized protein n=1 Tax=Solanum pinnatisectum TaxID=50273 RepID=A0AAV9L154_9SOLN|nr:hypothetical protein R3W88_016265 [Solanum pinnatisectum]